VVSLADVNAALNGRRRQTRIQLTQNLKPAATSVANDGGVVAAA